MPHDTGLKQDFWCALHHSIYRELGDTFLDRARF